MGTTIGDGIVVLALAGGIVGHLYIKQQGRQKRLEILHQERLAAMDKGIPLPELPLEPSQEPHRPDPTVLPILGTVLLSLSVGTMIALYLTLPTPSNRIWVAPLPFAFLGVGLIAAHFLKREPGR